MPGIYCCKGMTVVIRLSYNIAQLADCHLGTAKDLSIAYYTACDTTVTFAYSNDFRSTDDITLLTDHYCSKLVTTATCCPR